jgi:hypothetical protein
LQPSRGSGIRAAAEELDAVSDDDRRPRIIVRIA